MKAAGTYGAGNQLPIWVNDDGSYLNQSMPILKMLAMEHGYAPASAKAVYETEWLYSTVGDVFEKPERFAIMKDDASDEDKQKVIDILNTLIDKCEAQWNDGRAHVGGDAITHADFMFLSLITSHYENAHCKHPSITEAASKKVSESPNVSRVLQPMRELCADQIANMPESSI